jgi:drug/metabolite transporter (DMT)-like permease
MMITHVKLLLTAIFWGGTFIAGRIVSKDMEPFSAAFFRFLIANVFMVLLLLRKEPRLPRLGFSQILLTICLGATGIFLYNVFFFEGLKTIEASRASLIIALNPVLISAGAAIFYKDKWGVVKVLGMILSLAGAATVITRGDFSSVWHGGVGRGEFFMLGCVLSWVSFSLLGKKSLTALSPLASICYASIAGNGLLVFPAFSEGLWTSVLSVKIIDWIALFYLGFFGTVLGFVWYYDGIGKIGPAKAGLYINLVPVTAVMMGWMFLGERIGVAVAIGALLVVSGICITQQSGPVEILLDRMIKRSRLARQRR